jgi:hypothetical protein
LQQESLILCGAEAALDLPPHAPPPPHTREHFKDDTEQRTKVRHARLPPTPRRACLAPLPRGAVRAVTSALAASAACDARQ